MSREIINSSTRYGVLRRSQFISPFGVGSIVDFPDESLMPAGIDLWGNNVGVKIYDVRLQERLGVKYFKMVPSGEEYKKGIPFYRFPKWLFCPRCRSLRDIYDWQKRYQIISREKQPSRIPRCNVCKAKLVPSRFIVVCEKGHIDDFPWNFWAHHGKEEDCNNPDLEIRPVGGSSGLGGIIIKCKTCNKSRSMAMAFSQDAIKEYGCKGFKPWLNKKENCNIPLKTLQRGASNAYFPKTVSSIVIPPYSDDLIAEIESTDGYGLMKSQEGVVEIGDSTFISICKMIAQSINRNIEEVTDTVQRLLQSESAEGLFRDETSYRYDEFRAFLGDIDQGSINSRDFKIEILDGSNFKVKGLDKVVKVHRLREVRSLVAFSRLRPLDRNELDVGEEDSTHEVTGISVKEDRNINWLPAIEVRGEGIFLSFNNNKLEQWIDQTAGVAQRAELINARFNKLALELKREKRIITPKFILLHTLAHLLIRQLSFECGYGSASLRERIYCNENDEHAKMSGILIYTASGDAEGTLGGLVRQANPQFFKSIVQKSVKYAAWCSSDPLCIESSGQGMNSLNLAACHACVLLPETSCEELNRFLDRALVVGLPENPEIGYLYHLLEK